MFLRRRGVSIEKLNVAEYECRFASYQKQWDKTWQELNWGEKENKSLKEFSDSALEQAILEQKGKTH